jgi:hypothetical protein
MTSTDANAPVASSFVWTSVFQLAVAGAPQMSTWIDPLVQLPPEQSGFVVGQTLPHVPQLMLSLRVSAQYGAPPSGVQTDWIDVHCEPHPPFEQFWSTPVQTMPHMPQLALSLVRSAQYAAPPSAVHSVCVESQALVHCPAEHSSSAPHGAPHAPQFALSVFVLAQ